MLSIDNFYKVKKSGIYSSRCKKCDMKHHDERYSKSYKSRAVILCHYAKHRSKLKGIPIGITTQDIIRQYEQQNGKCYYSGRPLSPITGDENIMSIDRINSSIGYTPENIVLCCWKINKMKNDFLVEDFISLCKDVCHFTDNRSFLPIPKEKS